MKQLIIIAMIAVATILTSCSKESTNTGKTTVTVQLNDVDGAPVSGVQVRFYDEAGWSRYENDMNAVAQRYVTSDASGKAVFEFEYAEWFGSSSTRTFGFAVVEGSGGNFASWSQAQTIRSGSRTTIKFTIE